MADGIHVVGILVEQRASHGPEVQEVLTRFGSKILCRSGVPDPSKSRGIITVTMQAGGSDVRLFEDELNQIEGVQTASARIGDSIDNSFA